MAAIMTAKGIFLALVVLLFGLFALLNWEAVTLSRPVNLVVAQPSLPLGLVLIAVIVALSAVDVLLSLLSRARWLKEAGSYEKRLHYLRDALDRAQFEELEGVERRLTDRLSALERRVVSMNGDIEESLRKTQDHLDERILTARNDLSEDIARLTALLNTANAPRPKVDVPKL